MRRTDPSLSAERHRDAKCRATDSGRPRRPEKNRRILFFRRRRSGRVG